MGISGPCYRIPTGGRPVRLGATASPAARIRPRHPSGRRYTRVWISVGRRLGYRPSRKSAPTPHRKCYHECAANGVDMYSEVSRRQYAATHSFCVSMDSYDIAARNRDRYSFQLNAFPYYWDSFHMLHFWRRSYESSISRVRYKEETRRRQAYARRGPVSSRLMGWAMVCILSFAHFCHRNF